jgi:hypothetical protein
MNDVALFVRLWHELNAGKEGAVPFVPVPDDVPKDVPFGAQRKVAADRRRRFEAEEESANGDIHYLGPLPPAVAMRAEKVDIHRPGAGVPFCSALFHHTWGISARPTCGLREFEGVKRVRPLLSARFINGCGSELLQNTGLTGRSLHAYRRSQSRLFSRRLRPRVR